MSASELEEDVNESSMMMDFLKLLVHAEGLVFWLCDCVTCETLSQLNDRRHVGCSWASWSSSSDENTMSDSWRLVPVTTC